jgi:hypothetical protein
MRLDRATPRERCQPLPNRIAITMPAQMPSPVKIWETCRPQRVVVAHSPEAMILLP